MFSDSAFEVSFGSIEILESSMSWWESKTFDLFISWHAATASLGKNERAIANGKVDDARIAHENFFLFIFFKSKNISQLVER
ncbi:hypothetical protein [Pandoraea bronchicola]|uniref:hypothetical protein n=1 Tax=Pandoraea bronchicola TaxID=2508287 RepID=UPI001240AF18|nr:hypothetical protein [Pandoraea bronchicola]